MARGGKRPGAGRKAGSATKKTREIADRAASEGLTPLDYMLSILRDEAQGPLMRFEAAKAAAPYVHPKLASVEQKHSGEMTVHSGVDRPPRETREEWLARRQREANINVGSATGTAGGSH